MPSMNGLSAQVNLSLRTALALSRTEVGNYDAVGVQVPCSSPNNAPP